MSSMTTSARFAAAWLVPILPLLFSACDQVPTFQELTGQDERVEGEVPEQVVLETPDAETAIAPTMPEPVPLSPEQIVDAFTTKESRLRTNNDLEKLAGLPPEHLQQITALDLRDSQVNDPGAALLHQFPALVSLDLSGTAVTNAGMRDVARAQGLQTVVLDRMIIDGRGLKELAGHTQMKELSLINTPISDDAFEHLSRMTQLEVLRVSGTRSLQGHGFNELVKRNVLRNLRELQAAGTGFGFYGLGNLNKLTALEILVLADAQISDQTMPGIASCRKLRTLDIRQNPVGNEGLKYLARLNQLESLAIGGCVGVTDAGLKHLRGLKSLKHLDLNGCRCRTSAVRELKVSHLPQTEIHFDNQVF